MRNLFLLLCLCVVLPFSAQAAPTLQVQGEKIVLSNKGKTQTLPADDFELSAVEGADMRFLPIGDEAKETFGLDVGIYLFNKEGKQVKFIPMEFPESCVDVRFSPKGDIIALDNGSSMIRTWSFFTYPEMKALSETSYVQPEDDPSLIWNGNDVVLFSMLDESITGRSCGYDPCGPISVKTLNLRDGKAATLLSGTPECDYTMTGFDPAKGEVTARKICLASGKAWEDYPDNPPTQSVKVSINKAGK